MKIVDDAWNEAWDICHSTDGWKEEKKADNGDIVMSKKNKRGKKVYRIKIIVNCPPEKLINGLESTKDLTSWNHTLTKHEIIKELPNNVRISYQITTEAAGGMVSARDFIFIYKNGRRDGTWMEGGCSVDYPGPKDKKIVRAWNYPGGQFIRPASDPNKVLLKIFAILALKFKTTFLSSVRIHLGDGLRISRLDAKLYSGDCYATSSIGFCRLLTQVCCHFVNTHRAIQYNLSRFP